LDSRVRRKPAFPTTTSRELQRNFETLNIR
jgi:hypothetical protein